jgi:hypothetical protein
VPGRTFNPEPITGLGLDLERFTINGKAMAEDSTVRAELNIASPIRPGGFCDHIRRRVPAWRRSADRADLRQDRIE